MQEGGTYRAAAAGVTAQALDHAEGWHLRLLLPLGAPKHKPPAGQLRTCSPAMFSTRADCICPTKREGHSERPATCGSHVSICHSTLLLLGVWNPSARCSRWMVNQEAANKLPTVPRWSGWARPSCRGRPGQKLTCSLGMVGCTQDLVQERLASLEHSGQLIQRCSIQSPL